MAFAGVDNGRDTGYGEHAMAYERYGLRWALPYITLAYIYGASVSCKLVGVPGGSAKLQPISLSYA